MVAGWLTNEEGEYLREQAKASPTNIALEIGSLYGKSTLYILEGLKERFASDFTLLCVDPWTYVDNQRHHPALTFFKEVYERGFAKNVRMLNMTTAEALPIIVQHRYGFAFIDGNHEAISALLDLLAVSGQTEVMLVHDYASPTHMSVNEAVDLFVKHSGWTKKNGGGTIVKVEGKTLTHRYEQRKVAVPA